MASGILLPSLVSIATSTSRELMISSLTGQGESTSVSSSGPWSPPQWAQPALTMLTVPASSNSSTGQPAAAPTSYVFDAVFRVLHSRSIRKTQHPVLTGANVSDHAYVEPARVTLEVGMSDAMASFSAGVWVGWSTKSISAYQILKNLALNKTLFTLTTRLDTYSNMLIEHIDAPDENKTLHGLRATFTLGEIIAGGVTSANSSSSARPQTTGSNSSGTVQSTTPDPSAVSQHVLPSASYPNAPSFSPVPGSGNASSNNLGQLGDE